MTAGIKVLTDSACDLPTAMVDELGIGIIPLTIRFGTDELVDRRDLTPSQFWARVAATPELPTTAAPSPGAFEEAYRAAAADGATGVVVVTLSAELSATFQAAQLAAKAVEGTIAVRVIDSTSVTMAEGQIAAAAARLAQQGKSLDECAAAAEALVPRTRTYAALDTLDHLRRGGRIGAGAAFFGGMLSIKPIIVVEHGKVEPESKQRTRSRSLRYLVDKVRALSPVSDLAVMHGDAPDVNDLLDLLAEVHPREQIVVGDIGAVIGAHTGPRTIGVTFHVQPSPQQ